MTRRPPSGNSDLAQMDEQAGGSAHIQAPSFEAPPVVEVVLSVGFQPIAPLRWFHMARLWDEQFKVRFPRVEEQARYEMPMESLGKQTGPSVSLELLTTPPLPRLWFVDGAGSQLVQVQNDWFARNWRKAPGAVEYPRYPKLSELFRADLEAFQQYLRSEDLGEIKPTQCEVTYINHIPWPRQNDVGNLGAVLTLVAEKVPSFGVQPEAQQINYQYLVDREGESVGRLHVSANRARRVVDGADIIVMNLTVRGAPLGPDVDGVVAFQDLAREWAMQAFLGSTREHMHQIWRMRR